MQNTMKEEQKPAAELARLAKIEKAEAQENDEEWTEVEKAVVAKAKATLTTDQRDSNLNILLAKAEQYTAFLDRKLVQVADSANGEEAKHTSEMTDAEKDAYCRKEQPKSLTGGVLRDYQVVGYKWMVGLYENGLHGILADEMGLGKTIQTIALLAHLRDHGVYGPFLIVVPLSTITNWVREIEKFVPNMPCLLYHGTKEERAEMRAVDMGAAVRRTNSKGGGKRRVSAVDPSLFPVVVTTYEVVIRDRAALQQFKWKYIIVDEGHRLKNMNCQLVRELNILAGGSVLTGGANKLLLTGTPLQNNLTELWSLLNFLMPEIFDDLDFFISVFRFDEGVGSAQAEKEMIKTHAADQIVSKLHRILAPFMMRRLKTDVEKNMPLKREVVVYVPMVPEQQDMYQSIVDGELAKMLESATGNKTSLNNVMMQLRKCALHPYLHYEAQDGSGEKSTTERMITASGKLQMLDQMLKTLKKNGHKVLVFSQFTTMLDIIEDYLSILRPDMGYCRIDGSTKLADRREQMDEFNDPDNHEKFVFLLSTRAGGVGINLASADTVILFDSDWNPHSDNQAQDRAHRIGQTRDVVVYRLVTSRSVELRILELANSKRKLERVVCAKQSTISNSKQTKSMNADELRAMLQNDYTGHMTDHGDVDSKTLHKLLHREDVISGKLPALGEGYEIVQHKGSSLVGKIA